MINRLSYLKYGFMLRCFCSNCEVPKVFLILTVNFYYVINKLIILIYILY
jgi:hypothetical protein